MLGRGGVADLRRHRVVVVEDLVDGGERRGERHVGVLVLGRPLDRLGADHAGDPDRGMRLLERLHPRIHDAVLEVPALPAEGPGRRPRRHDDVVRLVEALAVVHGIDVGGHALLAEAAHEAAHHAPAREDVDHGHFLGHPERVVVDGQHVAEEDDLALPVALRHGGPDDVDGRHHAERVVVVLVDHDAVEARLGGVLQLVEVHGVELLGALGAELLVGEHQIVVAVPARLGLRVRRVAHLGEEVDLSDHGLGPRSWAARYARRKSSTARAKASGCSISGMCPAPSSTFAVAPGMARAY